MTVTKPFLEPPAVRPEEVFSRVVVGVDGTAAGVEACRQAATLLQPTGVLELVHVVEARLAVHTGLSAPRIAAEMEREGAEALATAARLVDGRVSARLLFGRPASVLLHERRQTRARLVAIGSHGHRRGTEIAIGGVAGEILHRAPCSVLIARRPASAVPFPSSLAVGIDGSPEADGALAVGRYLAGRFAAPLRIVTALRGRNVDLARIQMNVPFVEAVDGRPVEVLRDAGTRVDLLIVGSRGLHGLPALGSVSERVAHRAPCSVLVVRPQLR